MIIDHRSDFESTLSLYLGEPKLLMPQPQQVKGIRELHNVLVGHTTLKSTAAKILEGQRYTPLEVRIKKTKVEKTAQEKQKLADQQYDSDILYAAK